jgi:hypothetical protein
MIELARNAKSAPALGNVLTRAEDRLEAWRRLIPWPAPSVRRLSRRIASRERPSRA